MTAALTSVPKIQFFADDGTPLVGGKLYSYAAGTTTPLATYTTYAGTVANTNPVILNSRGEADVWLGYAAPYKLALYTATDTLIWTVDNIYSVNSGVFDGPVSGTTGTFSGALTAASGTFSGGVSGTTGTFSGALTAASGTFSGNVQMASQNGGQLAGLRNKIINGNMGVFQRGAATVTTSGNYGPADRWVSITVGDTFSTTQGSFVSGDTLFDTGGAQYFTQVAVTSVAGAGNFAQLEQRIEDVRLLAGQTVTVSFWAKAAAGTPLIGLGISQNFGTGGSPSASLAGVGQSQTLTTTWTKYSKTFTVPSLNGKTIGTTANTSYSRLTFWLDAGSTYNTESGSIGQASKTVSIAQVQLEVGSVATPFEFRPIGMELALCQRYYQIIETNAVRVTTYSIGPSAVLFPLGMLPVEMRAAPTVVQPTVTYTNSSAATVTIVGTSFARVSWTATITGTTSISSTTETTLSIEL